MAAAKLKILIEQGATFRKTLTWKAGTPPVEVNLAGCTARMQVRSELSSPVALVSLTTENGGIVLGGALGTIEIIITAAATAALEPGVAVYDLEIVTSTGDVRRLIAGAVTISPEVTR